VPRSFFPPLSVRPCGTAFLNRGTNLPIGERSAEQLIQNQLLETQNASG
jgi:hypothetical protein